MGQGEDVPFRSASTLLCRGFRGMVLWCLVVVSVNRNRQGCLYVRFRCFDHRDGAHLDLYVDRHGILVQRCGVERPPLIL